MTARSCLGSGSAMRWAYPWISGSLEYVPAGCNRPRSALREQLTGIVLHARRMFDLVLHRHRVELGLTPRAGPIRAKPCCFERSIEIRVSAGTPALPGLFRLHRSQAASTSATATGTAPSLNHGWYRKSALFVELSERHGELGSWPRDRCAHSKNWALAVDDALRGSPGRATAPRASSIRCSRDRRSASLLAAHHSRKPELSTREIQPS